MFIPGDIVSGKTDTKDLTPGHVSRNPYDEDLEIFYSKYKEILLAIEYPAIRYSEKYKNIIADTEERKIKKIKKINCNMVGLVVEVADGDGSDNHKNGVVAVLVGEEILWFFSHDLQLLKFSTIKTK